METEVDVKEQFANNLIMCFLSDSIKGVFGRGRGGGVGWGWVGIRGSDKR